MSFIELNLTVYLHQQHHVVGKQNAQDTPFLHRVFVDIKHQSLTVKIYSCLPGCLIQMEQKDFISIKTVAIFQMVDHRPLKWLLDSAPRVEQTIAHRSEHSRATLWARSNTIDT